MEINREHVPNTYLKYYEHPEEAWTLQINEFVHARGQYRFDIMSDVSGPIDTINRYIEGNTWPGEIGIERSKAELATMLFTMGYLVSATPIRYVTSGFKGYGIYELTNKANETFIAP